LEREGAETASERGGWQLLEASARYGDEIWTVVRRVPGMTQRAADQFGRQSLARLSKAPPQEVTRLIGNAERAENPKVREVLFERWARGGGRVLAKLDKRTSLILVSGLTLATLEVARGVAHGAEQAISALPETAPGAVGELISKGGVVLMCCTIALCVAFILRMLWSGRKSVGPRPGSVSGGR
jgi:hypothetical protein